MACHAAQSGGWAIGCGFDSWSNLGSESGAGYGAESGFETGSGVMEGWALRFWAWAWALRTDLQATCFHFGPVRVVVRVASDFGVEPKTTSLNFFRSPSRFCGPEPFHGETALYCICGGKGAHTFETAWFIMDETTSFREGS